MENYHSQVAGSPSRIPSDSIFDEYRSRVTQMELFVREQTAILRGRNDRLFGSDDPASAPPVQAAAAPAPIGPLAGEVQMALSNLNDAIGALTYQVERQDSLG